MTPLRGELWYNCSIKSKHAQAFKAPMRVLTNMRSELTMAIHDYTPKDIERFWSKVAITANPDLCWEWQAYKNPSGYGQTSFRHKVVYASRVAWELANGAIPNGLFVLHNCPGGDNPACCNPAHLFLGTQLDNVKDMVNKGRQAKGEHHSQRKLTVEKVQYIREQYLQGGVTQRQLAIEIGISISVVNYVINRKIWRDA